MENSEKNKKRVSLRSVEPCDDNRRFDLEDSSGKSPKRERRKEKDRKSSTTHDGDGSEMF